MELSYLFVEPLRLFYKGLFESILIFVNNFGIAIICLSITTSFLIIPLERKVWKYVQREKLIQNILNPQLEDIKRNCKGAYKNEAIKRLYNRYSYNPIYSIRLTFGILVQIPFLLGAFWMLSSYDELYNASFIFFKDLSKPDGLLWGFNLLPFFMTLINISSLLFLSYTKKENIQAICIALFFFVILYKAPSALLLYWTVNNLIHFIRVYIKFFSKKYQINISKQIKKYLSKYFLQRMEKDFSSNQWKYLIILSFLTSSCLLWFSNIGFFSIDSIVKSIILLTIVAFIFIFFVDKIKNYICKTPLCKKLFVIAVLGFSLVIFYFNGFEIIQNYHYKRLFIGLLLISLLLHIIGRFKLINFILFIQLSCAVIIGISQTIIANIEFENSLNRNINELIELHEKPNIYYILCESMNSLDIANNTFGVPVEKTDSLKNYLIDNGYFVPDYVYSNGNHTLMTMTSFFSMQDHIKNKGDSQDIADGGRKLIAGNSNNNVLRILKHNNYTTYHFLAGIKYFYSKKGEFLDFSDIIDSQVKDLSPLQHIRGPLALLFSYVNDKFVTKINDIKVEQDSLQILDNFFQNQPDGPYFFFHRLNYTNHTPSDGSVMYYNYQNWFNSGLYKSQYLKEMDAISIFSKKIIENDPDAIIVFCGDHGAWLYRAYPATKDDFIRITKESSITYEDLIDDKLKVFAAIRVPKKFKQIDGIFSPANIMAKIFDSVGYDGNLTFAPNLSYYGFHGNGPVVSEGKVIPLSDLPD